MKKFICWCLTCLWLSGCASLPSQQSSINVQQEWQTRLTRLTPVVRWEINGRMSIRDNEEAYRATLHWTRNRRRHRIDFTGPFGRRYVRLEQDHRGAVLYDKKMNVYRAPDAQRLLYRIIGWRVPLQGMNYWVLGVPVPGYREAHKLDAKGRLAYLKQSGWSIRFLEYRRVAGYDMPRKIYLSRTVMLAKKGRRHKTKHELQVRLVINRWKL